MKIAITGVTGFLGRYLLEPLAAHEHSCRCWHRPSSDRSGLDHVEKHIEWVEGELRNWESCQKLLDGCQALVHSALAYPAEARMSSDAFTSELAMRNIAGSLQLFEAARAAGVERVIYISSCAVHDHILDGRPLDETHPLWAASHYGAHKAAVEAFVHSFGKGQKFPICALRPTGIYGVAHKVKKSKWYDLVWSVVHNEEVECRRGGKEVHAQDVAQAVHVLLHADDIAGEVFNCYDRYISEHDVARLAKKISGSHSEIRGEQTRPKHEIENDKLQALGVKFGGEKLLEETIRDMIGLIHAAESVT
ncbi:MAG: NAD(P)-dependent oxidoreductase [Planctomycetota bacterium]|nr:MAG: NAD(P)-dependent oxidoreductase [Planctomycetota bacterium]